MNFSTISSFGFLLSAMFAEAQVTNNNYQKRKGKQSGAPRDRIGIEYAGPGLEPSNGGGGGALLKTFFLISPMTCDPNSTGSSLGDNSSPRSSIERVNGHRTVSHTSHFLASPISTAQPESPSSQQRVVMAAAHEQPPRCALSRGCRQRAGRERIHLYERGGASGAGRRAANWGTPNAQASTMNSAITMPEAFISFGWRGGWSVAGCWQSRSCEISTSESAKGAATRQAFL